jgi:hypothetical protein
MLKGISQLKVLSTFPKQRRDCRDFATLACAKALSKLIVLA